MIFGEPQNLYPQKFLTLLLLHNSLKSSKKIITKITYLGQIQQTMKILGYMVYEYK